MFITPLTVHLTLNATLVRPACDDHRHPTRLNHRRGDRAQNGRLDVAAIDTNRPGMCCQGGHSMLLTADRHTNEGRATSFPGQEALVPNPMGGGPDQRRTRTDGRRESVSGA